MGLPCSGGAAKLKAQACHVFVACSLHSDGCGGPEAVGKMKRALRLRHGSKGVLAACAVLALHCSAAIRAAGGRTLLAPWLHSRDSRGSAVRNGPSLSWTVTPFTRCAPPAPLGPPGRARGDSALRRASGSDIRGSIERDSLGNAVALKIARSLPLPLPLPAKQALVQEAVKEFIPQLESVLPAAKRRELAKLKGMDAQKALDIAAEQLADQFEGASIATKEQRVMVAKAFLEFMLRGEGMVWKVSGRTLVASGAQFARATVRDEDRTALVDDICQKLLLDKLIGEDMERKAVDSVVAKAIDYLDEVLPPDIREFLEVSNPREYKRWKKQLVEAALERIREMAGPAQKLLPEEALRPAVTSTISTGCDLLISRTQLADDSTIWTPEERISQALVEVEAVVAEKELTEERVRTLEARIPMLEKQVLDLEKECYRFAPWRWFKRWRRNRRRL